LGSVWEARAGRLSAEAVRRTHRRRSRRLSPPCRQAVGFRNVGAPTFAGFAWTPGKNAKGPVAAGRLRAALLGRLSREKIQATVAKRLSGLPWTAKGCPIASTPACNSGNALGPLLRR